MIIARIRFEYRLWKRRRIRLIESARVKQGQLVAQRKAWANDPLRRA